MREAVAKDSTESIEDILTELLDYKDYFTDKEKNKTLIEWVQEWLVEEWGLSKAKAALSARFAVKLLAPLIVSRLEKLGKVVTESWMKKAHEKLQKNALYFSLAQKLLTILKTKSDKAVGKAMDIPVDENLQALINNNVTWQGLKPEMQGLVQLLLGQNTIIEGQDQLQQYLQNIEQRFSFSLNLKTPEEFSTENIDDGKLTTWLTFRHRQAKLIGREQDILKLQAFYNSEANFSWWAVTGSGGIGKSRLALESLFDLPLHWQGGFLDKQKLQDSKHLEQWRPSTNTVIVIDYAAEYPEQIANWLDQLNRQQENYEYAVRLLILERFAVQQDWWETLVSDGTSASQDRVRCLHTEQLLELELLDRSQQKQALAHFLHSRNKQIELPDTASDLWGSLHDMSEQGRPLFLAMAAVAIADGDLNTIRHWKQQDLLKHVLQHEQRMWQHSLAGIDAEERETVFNLLAFSSVIGGLIPKSMNDTEFTDYVQKLLVHLQTAEILETEAELERFHGLLGKMLGGDDDYLQPDIFAEFFVLKQWKQKGVFNSKQKEFLSSAYKQNPENTISFIARSAVDYRENPQPRQWLDLLVDHLNQSENQEYVEHIYETMISITNSLSFRGVWKVALKWSLYVAEYETLTKNQLGRVLSISGSQYYYLGISDEAIKLYGQALIIAREIGDKLLEGRLLNNISQVLQTSGDNLTALNYLSQSMVISQEEGDKSGESMALNNISQVYTAIGDDDKALCYLNQALVLAQEIGDKSCEGASLNNMGALALARGDDEMALKYFHEALRLSREVAHKSGECSVLNNFAQVFQFRGDNEKALDYLNQSLVISQEMGDKLGEATSLSNIAVFSVAHGEDKKALDYINESLVIRQEIGDVSGVCNSKFNLGYIYWQLGNKKSAMLSWRETYLMARNLGFSPALDEMESLAGQLGLEGEGLEAWERLAEKLD